MSASTRTSSTTRHRNRERPAPEHRGRGVGRVHSRTVLLDRAALAQSAERLTRNEKVVGSIPTGGSTPHNAAGLHKRRCLASGLTHVIQPGSASAYPLRTPEVR